MKMRSKTKSKSIPPSPNHLIYNSSSTEDNNILLTNYQIKTYLNSQVVRKDLLINNKTQQQGLYSKFH